MGWRVRFPLQRLEKEKRVCAPEERDLRSAGLDYTLRPRRFPREALSCGRRSAPHFCLISSAVRPTRHVDGETRRTSV